jgi:inosine-uridine nucleoside N-ribohydrolase
MGVKVLLDTDIGSDIDDAVALAWLLANPDCELLGITTVTGEAQNRARLASVLCRAAGRRIPIFPGAEVPLLIGQKQKQAPQAAALVRWPHDDTFPEGKAVDFLQQTIRAHPGEVMLLTIGPLTNIALLFALDPAIPGLLKGIVMMCGVFSNRAAGFGPLEWNAMLDPHATAMVYHHAVAVHRSIGLDVTSQVSLEPDEVRRRFQAPLLRPVLDFSEVWFRHSGKMIFHDPLAAVSLFDPSVCAFEKGTVDVELASPRLAGATMWTRDAAGRHEVAFEVNRDLFFDRYFAFFE